MKILLLVNWKIKYGKEPNNEFQPSDYCYNKKFWFFKYFQDDVFVDVVDTRSIRWIEKIEKNYLRFYIMQTLKVLPHLNKYDLVISHGTTSGIFLAFLHRLLHLRMPPHVVVDISSFHKASTSGLVYNICRYASKKIDYLIYHTPIQKNYFAEHFPWLLNKSAFVNFGVDSDYWLKQDYPKKDKNEKNYIISVGYRKRDWHTLIQAYEKSNMTFQLLLIGKDRIDSKNKNIISLSFLPINELMSYIYNAYFCVLPLEYMEYSFGQMTLLQQMAIGKFVITADVPSVEPYKGSGIVKYIPGDVNDLINKLNYYFKVPEQVADFGESNVAIVKKYYSEEKMAHEIEKICQEVRKI